MVRCFGTNTGVFHIAPSGGFYADGGMCLNDPIDAAAYPNDDSLTVFANVAGYSRPNIRTIFPDGSDDVYYGGDDYMWVRCDWGGRYGPVKFELRNGSTVIATLRTYIAIPPAPEGNITLKYITAPEKVVPGTTLYIKPGWRNNTSTDQVFSVTLYVEGVAYRKNEWIPAGHTGTVAFSVTFDEIGVFKLDGSYNTEHIVKYISVAELLPPEGDIIDATWSATHPITGETIDIAYWGQDITVYAEVRNVGETAGSYMLQLYDGEVVLTESDVFDLEAGGQRSIPVTFIMPKVNSLRLTIKLVIS